MWHYGSVSQNMNNYTFSTYYQHSLPVAVIFVFAYILIFFVCIIGNIVICFILLKNKQMRTVTNIFILNLAISDLLVGIFCLPITLIDNLITGWPFDVLICKMCGLIQGATVSASVFTLVAIAVERCRCIVYPFKQKPTQKQASVTIAFIWALAFIIMCPSAVTLTVSRDESHFMVDSHNDTYPLYVCWEAWPEKGMRKIYTTVLFSHIYLAPVILIIITYACIALKLFRHRVSRRKIRVIHMLIFLALLFTVTWLPLWTLMLLTDYSNLTVSQLNLVTVYIFPFAHWLAFCNSSVNPFIYGYFNENFKRGFQAVFKLQLCWFKKRKHCKASKRRIGTLIHNHVFVEVEPHKCASHENRKRTGVGGKKLNELVLEDLD
ncbi:neuropeptide FF receptor 1-like [Conger conger]|uniref:neuropeptide FF receptor 1-like n=1 Tax=Conger conger TaxID=82655 RepID=UPI002A5AC23A|nr:neuropeptide FF receptor 1-like [Conger conger]